MRVTGIGERLVAVAARRGSAATGRSPPARWGSAVWHTLAWAMFGVAYVGAVVFVASVLARAARRVLLVLAAGARLSAYIGATVGEIGFLRGFWMDGSRRLAWLEDYAASVAASGDLPVPAALRRGIRLDHVSFSYPGTSRVVLDDVSVTLPAGAIVAIVGENGAGKTTLVKLLAKMYEPSSGAILVDDTPLARVPADEWRARLAGAFQDFFRFEFRARHTVGLGDVPRIDDEPAVQRGVDRAGARDVVARSAGRARYAARTDMAGGVELSFGQWQKLALARGFMRDEPLLLVLDEPTAALDAETEHALFERYAAAARAAANANGRITRPRFPPFLDRPHGRSDRRARRRPARRGRHARRTDGEARASTRSCTASRPPPTADAVRGCRMEDVGWRMSDAGCRMQDVGCRVSDAE